MKGCDICLASKAVRHKLYGYLQSLVVLTQRQKNLSIDFVMGLPVSTDQKGDSYDSIFVIVNRLTKMVHYKPVTVTINAPGLAEVIINVVVRYHRLQTQSSPTGGCFLSQSSGHPYAISLTSSEGYQPPFILKRMAKLKGRII